MRQRCAALLKIEMTNCFFFSYESRRESSCVWLGVETPNAGLLTGRRGFLIAFTSPFSLSLSLPPLVCVVLCCEGGRDMGGWEEHLWTPQWEPRNGSVATAIGEGAFSPGGWTGMGGWCARDTTNRPHTHARRHHHHHHTTRNNIHIKDIYLVVYPLHTPRAKLTVDTHTHTRRQEEEGNSWAERTKRAQYLFLLMSHSPDPMPSDYYYFLI